MRRGKTIIVCVGLAFWVLVGVPAVPAQEAAKTGCAATLDRWRGIAVEQVRDWRWREAGNFRGESLALDDSDWPVVARGQRWEAAMVWLRRWVEVPESRGGYDFRGGRLVLHLSTSWSATEFATVYVNGQQRTQGQEFEPLVLAERAEPGQKFLIAVRLQQAAGRFGPVGARIEMTGVEGRPNVQTLLEECVAAESLNESSGAGKAERAQVIEAARAAMDWAVLERGDQKRFDASLAEARRRLEPLRAWMQSHRVVAAGNAHIDMAWLWPWTETVEVVRNTFASVLKLMQEFPELKFTHSSVRTYAWMEEKYPELFEQVRRRVKEGRWELVGGMWVEPDLNMPDGESLVRQLLLGKRYLREKFGVEVRVGYNPDSFGYNWQLPQIYKKSGLDYFVTQKIYWNDTTRFPHKLFWWEAPDGSRVLTIFPHDYVNSMEPVRIARDAATYAAATGTPTLLHLYGIGDHGGGPTRHMLETWRAWQAPERLFPRVTLGTTQEFFHRITAELPKLNVPVWRNELYLEYHRGTYTTQAETKRNNRRNEALLLNAEKFSALASLFGRAYPQPAFQALWEKVLFNQFHDILPGSGIAVVYKDASREHAEVRRQGGEVMGGALEELAAHVGTAGAGVPVVVFNPLAWSRTDVVEAEVQFQVAARDVEVRDPAGRAVLSEVLAKDATTHRWRVRFVAQDVPSLGYKVFSIVPAAQPRRPATSVAATGTTMENEFFRVVVDAKTGCISSLYEKRAKRQALAPGACGNLLQAFTDKPKDWDAWNIDTNFEDEKWDLDKADEVRLLEAGALRAAIRVVKRFRKSAFTQDITLSAGVPRVDIRTQADWHETHVLIKAAFPVAAKSDVATFEIPYGSIERPTTRNTPEEKAKFEVPALRWADLSDAGGGLSLLNDSKYGYDAKGNVLRLSLLRSPVWPDPQADRGRHEFTYSLYPHAGGWREAGTLRRAWELNYPLLPVVTQAHAGTLPPTHSFVELDAENVVLTAVKKAEDDDALILRVYEFAGRGTQARVGLSASLRAPQRAWLANLMEQPAEELKVAGGTVVVPLKPYEIQTVKVQFAARSIP